MSEDADAKGDERRRRTTRAGRRSRMSLDPAATGKWQAEEGKPDRRDGPADAATLQDEDNLFASEADGAEGDDVYESLSELEAGAEASALAAERGRTQGLFTASQPPAVEPRARPTFNLVVGGETAPAADEAESEPDADAPTYPQIRLAELEWDSKPLEIQAPSVVVARATVIGDRVLKQAAVPPSPPSNPRTPSPLPEPPARPSSKPPPPSEVEDGTLQLMDEDEAELDGGQPQPSRSPPPPPPPPDARGRVAAPVSASSAQPSSQSRKPPPPPGPAPKADDTRKARKQARQWWERFFSEDYLATVLPPTTAQVAKQVDFIEGSIGVAKGGTILDVGCGLGLHAIELTRRGYLVVGLDLSLAMITHAAEAAQQKKLRLSFVHADIREMEFDGAFDGAICMGTTFGFFEDDANRDVLARLQQALRPGGRLLLDVVNRDYVSRFQPNLVWFEGDNCVCMEESDFNYFNARLSVKRTMMREDGHQATAEYSLRLYSLHELGLLVQQTGFRVIEVSGQEALRGVFFGGNSPRILLLAERRAAADRPARTHAAERERHSGEAVKQVSALPGERTSAEFVKTGKPSSGDASS